MVNPKTVATTASVASYLDSRATPAQRVDCAALMSLMARITGSPARMWGPSIVGFGTYRYAYKSGRSGEACLAGFAVRGRELALYLGAEGPTQAAWLGRLGPHRRGKACLYIKRLAELDAGVLAQLVADAVAEIWSRHGGA